MRVLCLTKAKFSAMRLIRYRAESRKIECVSNSETKSRQKLKMLETKIEYLNQALAWICCRFFDEMKFSSLCYVDLDVFHVTVLNRPRMKKSRMEKKKNQFTIREDTERETNWSIHVNWLVCESSTSAVIYYISYTFKNWLVSQSK